MPVTNILKVQKCKGIACHYEKGGIHYRINYYNKYVYFFFTDPTTLSGSWLPP
jgi:hypothetical protein